MYHQVAEYFKHSSKSMFRKGVPSAESSRSVRGLGKGVSGKPYPRLYNARRPRLEPGTFRSHAVKLYRLHQAPRLEQVKQYLSKIKQTLTNPVRRSKFKCRFLTCPNSWKAFWRSSSWASSCTPVTNTIHPSIAATREQNKHTWTQSGTNYHHREEPSTKVKELCRLH